MSGREAKTTISDLLRMPRHQKEITSEKWLKDLLLGAKRVGQLTGSIENHRYLFFKYLGSAGRNEGASYTTCEVTE